MVIAMCGCAGSRGSPTVASQPPATIALATSTSPRLDPATTDPSVTATTTVPTAQAVMRWPGSFAVAERLLPLSFRVEGLSDASTRVTLTPVADDATPVRATYEPNSRTWNATVPIPRITEGSLRIAIDATDDSHTVASSLELPVAAFNVVDVSNKTVAASQVATLAWGNGPGQIGTRSGPDGESEMPTSIAFDSRSGAVLILDTVNHRIVEVASGGNARELQLPGDSLLTDVVIDPVTGTAIVIGWEAGNPPRTSAMVVDLQTDVVRQLGPVELPQSVPVDTPFVLNEMDQMIYGVINNRYYPYLDVSTETLAPTSIGETAFSSAATDTNYLTFGFGTSTIGVQMPGSLGGLSDVQVHPDSSIWFLNTAMQSTGDGQTATSVLLARANPADGTATTVMVPDPNLPNATRRMVATDGTAVLMRATAGGLVVERYDLG
jgi:hypothetical protein